MNLKEKQIIYVDNKPHIKCNVVMLPHNNIDTILTMYLDVNKKPIELSKNNSKLQYHTNQHLYITSNEEIKEGDYYLKPNDNSVWIRSKNSNIITIGSKKIIATTDESLTINMYDINGAREVDFDITLPQPSQQFIEKYIEEYNKGNIIAEVLVEVEEIKHYSGSVDSLDVDDDYDYIEYKLKLDSQNQITIRKVKDSWNREEVIDLCRSAYLYGEQGALKLHNGVFKEWIEENL